MKAIKVGGKYLFDQVHVMGLTRTAQFQIDLTIELVTECLDGKTRFDILSPNGKIREKPVYVQTALMT